MPAGSRNARRRGGRKPKPVGAAGTRATPSPTASISGQRRQNPRRNHCECRPNETTSPGACWAWGGRPPAAPCHTIVRTGPYTAVRDGYASIPRIRTECGLGFRFQSSPRTAQPLPFPSRLSGFTRQRRREVQFDLGILLFVVLETHGLLASPSRSGLRPSFPAWPIHCSAFRHSECLTSLADVTT